MVTTTKLQQNSTSSETKSSFTLKLTDDNYAIIYINIEGESQNTLKVEFNNKFNEILKQVDAISNLNAVIITSDKKDSFIAGADITMLKAADTEEAAFSISQLGQQLFTQLENRSEPVIAAIDGACLGGGLELALACHGRVCTDNTSTRLGLPEVQLGLLPGGGGTQRLPRLIGIANALDLMLTGKMLSARRAMKTGLVDEVVASANLIKAAKRLARTLKSQTNDSTAKKWSISRIKNWLLEENRWGRELLFSQARKRLQAKTGGHYPAPEYIVDAVEIGIERGLDKGYKAESELFAKLVVSAVAKELINIFFATTEMKKQAQQLTLTPIEPFTKIGILGAGLMGAGIAFTSIDKAKVPVRLKDRDDKSVLSGLRHIYQLFARRLNRKSISKIDMSDKLSLITATTDYSGFDNCDLVIEAVYENLELKQSMLTEIEKINKNAVFASNTSSIPITEIAQVSKNPQNVIGLHYFSPVEKMPLLEVIKTAETSQQTIARSVKFGYQQGKTVIVVNDGPGFYTSRILAPYMNEAGFLLSEGVAIDAIDGALKQFGFPVGPFNLLDEVGIDVGTKIAPVLVNAFGKRLSPPDNFTKLAQLGRLGRKNKKGFYLYNGKSKQKQVDETIYTDLGITPGTQMGSEQIAERCVLQMLNEAALCLQEKIIENPRDGDIGAIFGLGFPPFTG
ncbi:MAG TPA: fatty acid oxidation complex subunit alpha FadJ, partial [Aeromonadales bacterium]|nr:fatty acid oxidation complex subunit alpha FadJ [Aeromonadales bacterium]